MGCFTFQALIIFNISLFCEIARRRALRLPAVAQPPFSFATNANAEPICVAARVRGKKRQNIFYDDRGYPNQLHEFDVILHNIDGGTILRKRKHPALPINKVDPSYFIPYNKAAHGAILRRFINLSHLPTGIQQQVYQLLQKYWSIFDNKGQFVPIKDYQCVINTGTARPISVKNIHYGLHRTPIMRKCIAALKKIGHIRQVHDSEWQFKALLMPKPYQEHICNITDFVWQFCVNYIRLNQVTHPIVYSIPRCDSAVNLTFSNGQWVWLWDAPLGYHQIGISPCSQDKLAFAGPDATKWTYNIMPFGPISGPPTFTAFIHDLDSTWKDLARQHGIVIDKDTNTNIIVDHIFSYAKTLTLALTYMECQLKVA